MLCRICGKKITGDDLFCSGCGTRITAADGSADSSLYQKTDHPDFSDKNPIISIQPVFNSSLVLMTIFPFQLFISIWATMFFGGLILPLTKTMGGSVRQLHIHFLVGIFFFIAIPVCYYYITKKNYSKSWYRFFGDRLEFYEGFFIIQEKTIKYCNITELNLRRGFLQRYFKLGTIIISTPATGYSRGRAISGIKIRDIAESEIIYRKVKEIVDKAESEKI